MPIIVSLALIGVLLYILFIYKRRKVLENNLEYKSIIESVKTLLYETNKTPNSYLTETDRLIYSRKVGEIASELKTFNIPKRCLGYSEYKALLQVQQNISTIFDSMNQKFIDIELQRCEALFNNIDGKSLDLQQREAVVTDELHNLIIAGAGSGKTLTISGKVSYLCSEKGILPEEILLIAFTKKAAEEMTERINNRLGYSVNAVTFHKLGLDIISNAIQRRPDIFDGLDTVVSEYFQTALKKNDVETSRLLDFFAYYLSVPADIEKYSTFGEYIDAEHSADFETIKSKYEREMGFSTKTSFAGEKMRSIEEVMIANFLFLHGIQYEYERLYPYKSEDPYRKLYRPDFYLPEYDIYLEHFGINEDEKCPWLSPIESEKYVSDMHWKRDFHKKNGTKLIETYSYYRSQGLLLQKLEEILLSCGVEYKPVDKSKVLEQAYLRNSDRNLKEFNNLVCSFIRLYKSNGYGFEHFAILIKNTQSENNLFFRERNTLFLSITERIYTSYQNKLLETDSIDFSDMIIKATSIIETDKPVLKYKYVIIDEYQDIGIDRFKLVKAILMNTGAKLMCVGDDWQSIYRFAGSDVNLFTSFEKYWGATKALKIEQTYRNAQELIDIAGTFVMKNSVQIP